VGGHDMAYSMHQVFDLKGSTGGRANMRARKWALSHPGSIVDTNTSNTVMKDLDMLALGKQICLKGDVREMIKHQLEEDYMFLRRWELMDYSTLVTVRYRPLKKKFSTARNEAVLQMFRSAAYCKPEDHGGASVEHLKTMIPGLALAPEVVDSARKYVDLIKGKYLKIKTGGGGVFGRSRERKFECHNGFLCYYTNKKFSDGTSIPHGIFNLALVTSIKVQASKKCVILYFSAYEEKSGTFPHDIEQLWLKITCANATKFKNLADGLTLCVNDLRSARRSFEFADVRLSRTFRPSRFLQEEGGLMSTDKSCCYYIGVIDMLTKWTMFRSRHKLVKNSNTSQQDPETYLDRITKRLESLYLLPGDVDPFAVLAAQKV